MNDLPFFKFYPADWMSDEKLRLCSRSARGLWLDMLCLMWKAERRGFLEMSRGNPLTPEQMARVVGCTPKEIARDLAELKGAGVYSIEDGTGVIFSRRIIREEQHRETSSKGGSTKTELKSEAARRNGANGGRRNNPTETQPEPNRNPSEHPTKPKPQRFRGSEVQNKETSSLPAAPGAGDAESPVATPRPRNVLLDALATVGGGDPTQVPAGRWSAVQRCLRDIKSVCPEVTVEEIARRCQNYRKHYSDAKITPEALAKHWALCDNPPLDFAGTPREYPGMSPDDPIMQRRNAF
jgi:hypothetical protein